MDIDDTNGAGPENISLLRPETTDPGGPGYRVGVQARGKRSEQAKQSKYLENYKKTLSNSGEDGQVYLPFDSIFAR